MSQTESMKETQKQPGSPSTERDELIRMRILLYDLAKSLFVREPDMETCRKWKTIFGTFARMDALPELSSASENINEILDKKGCKGVLMEYHELFIDPYSKNHLNTTASWHADGRNYGPSLASVRQLMDEAGVEKDRGYPEPEDSVEVLMDTMIRLMSHTEAEGENLDIQQRMFRDFILPLVQSLNQRMEQLHGFPFYRACASFLDAWLQIEHEFMAAAP